ncbi:hypothetical protein I316_06278 [Kwoniella heveanensis BCC8398]|uniref:Xylanolytic transcriptional activator regulatory domain-containing protein n=1 Tax=Kwoniella heveanensis BCC8398 TaxID=1296120 RepID=A0A1B9GM97_9TREE|nr:hypothetical protein I316_06278 [Kwoniella heveanensis BCC8398]
MELVLHGRGSSALRRNYIWAAGLEARRSMLNMKRTQNNNSSVQDPTWEYLSRLLEISNPHVSDSTLSSTVDDQFFPGRTQNVQGDNAPTSSAYQSVMNNIPRDLLVSLLNLFFKNIHPSWPVLHADYVFARLDSWGDATFGAMIVAMCMLASRYSIDPRVLQDQTDRRSAGMLYVPLFETLLSGGYRNDVYEVAALFFASLFFCTDNIPQPRALKYFATAYAFCIDAGFHRDLPMSCPVEPHEREMRNRIAWALYCYDKFLSTICGRHPWLPLGDIDCDIPQHYPALSGLASHSTLPDAQHTETFNGLIGVSAVLNYALKAVCHRPLYPNSPFLDQLAMRMAKQNTDEEALDEVIDHLGTWKRQLPNRSGRVSVAGEQIATTELVVRLLVSARRLQLAQANNDMNVHQYRPPVVSVAKELINVYVQLGAHNCLHQCSSLDAYKLLLAARLLIACHLGADTAHDEGLKSQCQSALHAAALLLQMLVAMNPVVLGSAEVLFETCRVYQVDIGVPDGFNLFDSPIGSKPWYQPFGRHAPGRSLSPSSRFGTSQSFEQASSSTSENTAASTFHSMVRETHERLATLGESELPDLEYTLDSQIADLDWLFPGP